VFTAGMLAPAGSTILHWNAGETTVKTVTVSAPRDFVIQGAHYGYLNSSVAAGDKLTGTITGLTGRGDEFDDSAAAFTTANGGLRGYVVRIVAGQGAGQERYIWSNTAT